MSLHDKTKAVLIGNWDFPNLGKEHSILNIKENLKRMRNVLESKIDIPPGNIIEFPDMESGDISVKLEEIMVNCPRDSTFLLYYAGHGFPDNEGLFWATKNTKMNPNDKNKLITSSAISTDAIKKYFEKCSSKTKILICDCCYAASMMKNKQGGSMPGYIKQKIDIEGTFYMFSSDASKESLFPAERESDPTYFTQALLNAIEDAVEPQIQEYTIGMIYEETRKQIEKLRKIPENDKEIPFPIKREDMFGDEFVLFENRYYLLDEAGKEFNELLENPDRLGISAWIQKNFKHPRRQDAFNLLKEFDSADHELQSAKSSPKDQRADKLLEVAAKHQRMPKISLDAMSAYVSEQGGNDDKLKTDNALTGAVRNEEPIVRNEVEVVARPAPGLTENK